VSVANSHGLLWIGAFHVVYNCTAWNPGNCLQDAPGTTDWIVGFKGGQAAQSEFNGQATRVMSPKASVEPRSLCWHNWHRMGVEECLIEAAVGSKSKRLFSHASLNASSLGPYAFIEGQLPHGVTCGHAKPKCIRKRSTTSRSILSPPSLSFSIDVRRYQGLSGKASTPRIHRRSR